MLLDDLKKAHEREVLRFNNKYEKKLLGMQKKYILDMDGYEEADRPASAQTGREIGDDAGAEAISFSGCASE